MNYGSVLVSRWIRIRHPATIDTLNQYKNEVRKKLKLPTKKS